MKKSLKVIVSIFTVLLFVSALASCNHADTYRKFVNNGSNLPKSHILKEISYKELFDLVEKTGNGKKDDGETEEGYIYVFFGTPSDSLASSEVTIFNEQAQQYLVKTLYWVDSNISDKKKDKIESRLGINDISETVQLWSFNEGSLSFDSTKTVCKKEDGKASGSDLTPQELARNCFKNLTTVKKTK